MQRLILIFSICICFSCADPVDELSGQFHHVIFQYIDSTGNKVASDAIELWSKHHFQKANPNPGELEFDTWYVFNIGSLDHDGHEFIEVAKPRTKIAEVYAFNKKLINDRKLQNINSNVVRIDPSDELILFKIAGLTRQVTLDIRLFRDIKEVQTAIQLDLFFISFVLLLSGLLLLYAIWQSILTRKSFFIFFVIIQIWFIFFLLYDTGFARSWFGDSLHIWIGRISVLIYLISILPFIYSHFRPDNSKSIRWIFGSSLSVVVILLNMMVFIPITHTNSTIFVDILRIFRLTSPLLILYFYKDWFRSKPDFIFTLIITLFAIVPILKSIQNTRILESPILEYSFSVSMIIQSLLWFLYFGIEWKENSQKKLDLLKENSKLEEGYKTQLIKGQEQERKQINQQIQEEIAPAIQALQLLIATDTQRSKSELDEIIEELRYLSRKYISADLDNESLQTELLRFLGLIKTIKPVDIILEYQIDNEVEIEPFLQMNIYRLVQDAVTFSITQGQSSTIIVQLLGDIRQLSLFIEDNSKIDNTQLIQEGEALKNLKARFSDFKHELRINHTVGKGTYLEIVLTNVGFPKIK